jgi:pantetheine-phosphate adenylyltransferase
MTTRTGIYPGTFDPITHGHMDIVRRALKVVDRLVIAVAVDSGKEPIFGVDFRAQLAAEEMAQLGTDASRVEVKHFSGLLASFAQEQNAHLLIRGLRAVSDFEYEFQMASVNNKISPELETVFLTASEATHFISSRFVKQIARLGGNVSHFVSANVEEALRAHFMLPQG